jgi:hypothetical protein
MGQIDSFDPDWAGPGDWAAMYRRAGWQVVPSHMPGDEANWKRPALKDWKSLQETMVPDATFARWYGGAQGEHIRRQNMGLLTGRASSNVFVIDLDDYKAPEAAAWWRGLMAIHNDNMDIETPQQMTGGGGRQLFFKAPEGWLAPTNKTPIGVDVRGQGGFAVLPPSQHISGKEYAWKPGAAPWECEIALAPDWLLQAVNDLVERYGGDQHHDTTQGQVTRTANPQEDFNAFGARVDGRDHYMRDLIWAAIIEWRRECPILPSKAEHDAKMREVWATYERQVKTRLPGDNAEGLEREGRGWSMFAEKWRRAMSKWNVEIADEARKPVDAPVQAPLPAPLPAPDPSKPLILSSAEFVAGFRSPQYAVDKVIQRSYLYTMTARTGHGKTAVAMYLALMKALGLPFHGLATTQGSVLFLAGENPDDVRARFLVLCDYYKVDPATVPIYFVDGVIDIAASLPRIRAEADKIPDLGLVIVDTAAAYFRGDDGNSNVQQGAFARMLRQLSFLPGKPAVVVPCHPVKNAAKDNLLPVGGGAFLNEVDGNLTLWANTEKQATLHWQGKFRGPEFEPMAFNLVTHDCNRVVDSAGEMMPSIVAVPISQLALERGEADQESIENLVMKIVAASPLATMSQIADRAKVTKAKVQRIFNALVDDKLMTKHRKKYRLTEKGKKEIGVSVSDD